MVLPVQPAVSEEVDDFAELESSSSSGTVGGSSSHSYGDFNGDGISDLVAGAPFEDSNTSRNAGAVHIIYGSNSGLSASGNQFWKSRKGEIQVQPVLPQLWDGRTLILRHNYI